MTLRRMGGLMTYISKCFGKDCPLRDTCWRYLAPAGDFFQSYLDIQYKPDCSHYWEVKNEKIT